MTLTMARLLSAVSLFSALGFGFTQDPRLSASSLTEALLVEVRQLRLALERSALVSARITIVLHRVQATQDRVDRLSAQLESLRKQVADAASWDTRLAVELSVLEARSAQEENPAQRKELEQRIRAMKNELERRAAREPQQRAAEAEILGQIQAGQSKLNELSAELSRLEKSLPN